MSHGDELWRVRDGREDRGPQASQASSNQTQVSCRMAVHTPAVRHLVDEHEPQAAGLERVAAARAWPGRRPERPASHTST